jgi:energy-coupling factor transporter transmembrane protein EcfT
LCSTYLETTICDVLDIFTVLVGRNGKIKLKLYWTFTFTVLPGLLFGVHVVVTVMELECNP